VRSIAWLSEKGGSGKSTCAINTAVALAKSGRRVLVIDADPQANSTMVFLKGRGADAPTLCNVLTNEADAEDAIRSTDTPNLDILPADGMLADANVLLVNELGREKRLRLAMQDVGQDYDYIIVDTSPQRTLINVNVLNYVGEVYCPIDPGVFGIAGLLKLREAVDGVVRFLDNPTLRIAGLVVNRVQRDNLSRDTESQLREAFGPLVATTTIPASTKIGEAHSHYLSVLDYAPGTAGAKAFEALTREIIGDGEGKRTGDGVDGVAQGDDGSASGPGRGRRRRAG
jgi:chromosome partitioning protein